MADKKTADYGESDIEAKAMREAAASQKSATETVPKTETGGASDSQPNRESGHDESKS